MKVGVTGTQYGWTERQRTLFTLATAELNLEEFHHGDCIGVDEQAAGVIRKRFGVDVVHSHPPNQDVKRAFAKSAVIYKAKHYLARNQDIVDAVDLLYVIPNSAYERRRSGTWVTYRRACKAGTRMVIIFPDGSLG